MRAPVRKRYTPAPGEGSAERAIVQVINGSWPVLDAAASTAQARAMIAARNAAGFIESLPWQDFIEALGQATIPMARQIDSTVTAAMRDLEAAVQLTFANQDVVSIKYAQTQGAKMIRSITESQRATFAEVISRALAGDHTVDQAAAIIQRSVGLHPAWATAVERYHAVQFERLRKDFPSGKALTKADSLADRYSARLVKRRAETIARTEIQTASNLGRFATWAQSIGSGVARSDSLKEWSAGPGACELCHRLSGQTVLWDAPFSTGNIMPPAHPNCRCTAVLLPSATMSRLVQPRTIDWTSPVLSLPDDLAEHL